MYIFLLFALERTGLPRLGSVQLVVHPLGLAIGNCIGCDLNVALGKLDPVVCPSTWPWINHPKPIDPPGIGAGSCVFGVDILIVRIKPVANVA